MAPFGLLVEKAGGKTSDGVTGGSVLDIKITKAPPPKCLDYDWDDWKMDA